MSIPNWLPMEKLLNPYDKEYMRMAILKHEETFREQVYELHRLYEIQKILMKNIEEQTRWNFNNSATRNQMIDKLDTSERTRQCLDLERPAEEHNAETGGEAGTIEAVDESELELTLGPSSFHRRMRSAAAAEPPLPSDSGTSFSSSSTGSSRIKRTITSGSSHQKIIKPRPVTEEHLRQDTVRNNNNNPPWLFQVLHLNMT